MKPKVAVENKVVYEGLMNKNGALENYGEFLGDFG